VGLLAETNGNNVTKLMHLLVRHELNRMHLSRDLKIELIAPEKPVLLEKNSRERQGRFDFLVRAQDRTIGIEVLSRPTKGKLKQKLPYAESVDEFIFVLPENALQLYRKQEKKLMHEQARPLFFPPEFGSGKLRAWLLSMPQGQFVEKSLFSRIFNVK
jgi:hypothetical protein